MAPEALPLRRVREILAGRVEAGSLRSVAAEIGVTPSGLRYFLDGGKVYLPTLRKLEDWYLKYLAEQALGDEGLSESASGEDPLDAEDLALWILLRNLPKDLREEGLLRSLGFYSDLYDRFDVPLPDWLTRLRGDRPA